MEISVSVLLLFLLLQVVSATSVFDPMNELLRLVMLHEPESPKRYEKIADYSLGYALSKTVLEDKSIFIIPCTKFPYETILSKPELYELLLIGGCDHINGLALNIIKESKKKQPLSVEDKRAFTEKLRLIIKEENYFKIMGKESFEFPEKTLKLVFMALEAIDPDFDTTFDHLYKLAKYCTNEECLSKVLPKISHGLETSDKPVPFIKFNNFIKEFESFDAFIVSCAHRASTHRSDAENLIKNIIYGPVSTVSTRLLYEHLNEHILVNIFSCEESRNRLVRRIIKSETLSTFMNSFFTEDIMDRNEQFSDQLQFFFMQTCNFKKIKEFINMDVFGISPEEQEEQFNYLIYGSIVMEEYYEIDPEFIGTCVVKIHEKIQSIINITSMNIIESESTLTGLVSLLFCYLNLIPPRNFEKYFPEGTNYENVLDLLLNSRVSAYTTRFVNREKIFKLLSHSYIKVDDNYYEKLWRVFELNNDNNEEVLEEMFYTSLYNRLHQSQLIQFEIFKMIHRLAESRKLNFAIITRSVIFDIFHHNPMYVVKQYLDYCVKYDLISKSVKETVEKTMNIC